MQTPDKKGPSPIEIGNYTYNKYPELRSKVIGGLQIAIGILLLVPTLILFGVVFIVAGSFGIVAGREKTKCKIVAFMALSIVASVLAVITFAVWFYAIYGAWFHLDYGCQPYLDDSQTTVTSDIKDYLVDSSTTIICSNQEFRFINVGYGICVAILAALEAGLSILASVMCYKVVYCGTTV